MTPRELLALRQLAVCEQPHLQAQTITEMLSAQWPEAVLCACTLGNGQFAVLDGAGAPAASWYERLHPSNFSSTGLDLARDWCERLSILDPPSIVRSITTNGVSRGCVALMLPASCDADQRTFAEAFLEMLAKKLGLALALDSSREETGRLNQMVADLDQFASLGELAGPLAHEVANFLNVLLLQVAVLEHQLPDKHRADLNEIRRQGAIAAQLISSFYEHRQSRKASPSAIALNSALRAIARELEQNPPGVFPVMSTPSEANAPSVSLTLDLCDDDPKVRATECELRRMLRFLIANAMGAAADGGRTVSVTTRCQGDHAVAIVEDSGPTPGPEVLLRMFEPSQRNRTGVDVLEIAATRSIARRLGASIHAEARDEGGLRLSVAFAAS